jgi:hypothetical protein
MRPIDGAIWQVSVPTLLVGVVWARTEEADTAIPISVMAMRDLNIAVVLLSRRAPSILEYCKQQYFFILNLSTILCSISVAPFDLNQRMKIQTFSLKSKDPNAIITIDLSCEETMVRQVCIIVLPSLAFFE